MCQVKHIIISERSRVQQAARRQIRPRVDKRGRLRACRRGEALFFVLATMSREGDRNGVLLATLNTQTIQPSPSFFFAAVNGRLVRCYRRRGMGKGHRARKGRWGSSVGGTRGRYSYS